MKKLRILPYKMGSQSAKTLAQAVEDLGFDVLRVHKDSPTYRRKLNHVVLNWGASNQSKIGRAHV